MGLNIYMSSSNGRFLNGISIRVFTESMLIGYDHQGRDRLSDAARSKMDKVKVKADSTRGTKE